jgi:hypothetical protein
MAHKRRRPGFGWTVVDLLGSLVVTFLVLSLTISDSPATPQTPGEHVGALSVKLTWDLRSDSDVDLWMVGPNERKPVGFTNPHGTDLNLSWDDLGRGADPDSTNTEFGEAEKAPAGEYVVNAFLYNDWDGMLPVHVHVRVKFDGGQTLNADGTLTFVKQEITLMRFRVEKSGMLVWENNLSMHMFGGVASSD